MAAPPPNWNYFDGKLINRRIDGVRWSIGDLSWLFRVDCKWKKWPVSFELQLKPLFIIIFLLSSSFSIFSYCYYANRLSGKAYAFDWSFQKRKFFKFSIKTNATRFQLNKSTGRNSADLKESGWRHSHVTCSAWSPLNWHTDTHTWRGVTHTCVSVCRCVWQLMYSFFSKEINK